MKHGGPDEVFQGTERNMKTKHVKALIFKWEIIVCLIALHGCQGLLVITQIYSKESVITDTAVLIGLLDLGLEVLLAEVEIDCMIECDCARYLVVLLFLTSTDAFSKNSE